MDLQEKLLALPTLPGVYLFKSASGEVLYVGKAKNLRNRVRSYFQSANQKGPRITALVSRVEDLEYIVTGSEVEALILESNVIKTHAPWYNIKLKDDKAYPYVKVTLDQVFPRVISVRKKLKDKARYFGPFTDANSLRETLRFLRKLFPLRTCSKTVEEGMDLRPCLNYHIKRCNAPCASLISKEEYGLVVSEVLLFLEGRHEKLIPNLKEKMMRASQALKFEEAAALRDRILGLEKMIEKQKVVSNKDEDQDVLGFSRTESLFCVQIFFVRSGKLIGRDHFILECGIEEEESLVLTSFMKQYYSETSVLPKEVLLPFPIEELDLIEEWLSSLKGKKVECRVPKKGPKKNLVDMVTENATIVLEEIIDQEARKSKDKEVALKELKEALSLPRIPHRMECFDISNTQGNQVVASMVVFFDGSAAKEEYRRFKIRSVEGAPNDFQAMQEVISRRLLRGKTEALEGNVQSGFGQLPDLIIVDGGKGQLSAAIRARDALGLQIPLVGLAKKWEEVFLEGQSHPVLLPKQSKGMHLMQRIRDEAHRFAISYHRNLRDKESLGSMLDSIKGVGPKRKKALLGHFGSVKGIRAAEVEELAALKGMSVKLAEEIYEYLHKEEI